MAKKAAKKTSSSLQEALQSINKKHGDGSVMKLGKGQPIKKVDTLSTGIYSIDRALGGGFARGRIIELYGNEGSGKTTLALQTVVQAQSKGEKAAYIDVEHAFDMGYAKSLGVDVEELYFSQPDSAEEAFDIANTLARTGEFSMIIVDSVAALVPMTEFDSDIGKSQIGHLARFMSSALKQVASEFSKTNTSLILINQLRMKIGIAYGNPETTPGGTALKYYASQRLAIRKSTKIENADGDLIGYTAMIKIEKNKIALPHQKTQVPFINGKGFDRVSDIFNFAIKMNVIYKEKISYYFGKEKIGVGENASINSFRENEELQNKVVDEIEKVLAHNSEQDGE